MTKLSAGHYDNIGKVLDETLIVLRAVDAPSTSARQDIASKTRYPISNTYEDEFNVINRLCGMFNLVFNLTQNLLDNYIEQDIL